MTFDEINDRIAEREHEFGGPTQRERDWVRFNRDVRKALELESLDGDQDVDGYSLDTAHDYFVDGCSVDDAVAEFRVSIRDAVRINTDFFVSHIAKGRVGVVRVDRDPTTKSFPHGTRKVVAEFPIAEVEYATMLAREFCRKANPSDTVVAAHSNTINFICTGKNAAIASDPRTPLAY